MDFTNIYTVLANRGPSDIENDINENRLNRIIGI